ncbi:ABC transporter permease [bacterium]|nr:ABC transporter permease [bacterium]
MSGGATTYLGDPKKYMKFVEVLGHVPDQAHINPADYALALVCSDFEETSEGDGQMRVQALVDAWIQHEKTTLARLEFLSSKTSPKTVSFHECILLSTRMLISLRKDPVLLYGRFALIFIFSTTLGTLNKSIEHRQTDVTKWVSQTSLEASFLPTLSILTIPSFAMEAAIVSKEVSNGTYSVGAYCVATAVVQTLVAAFAGLACLSPAWLITTQNKSALKFWQAFTAIALSGSLFDGLACILGFVTPNFLFGQVVDAIVVIGLNMFSGMSFSLDTMPGGLRFMYWITPFRYISEVINSVTFKGYNYGVCQWGGACFNRDSANPFEHPASGRTILRAFNYEVSGFPDYKIDDVNIDGHLFVLLLYAVLFRMLFYFSAQSRLSG